jgi:hypothetical protein
MVTVYLRRRRRLHNVCRDDLRQTIVTPFMQHLKTTNDQIALHMQTHRWPPAIPTLVVTSSIKGRTKQAEGDEWAGLWHDSLIRE